MKNRIKSIAIVLLFSFLGVQLISIACTVTNFCHQVAHNINAEGSHQEHNHRHDQDNDHHHDFSKEDTEEDNCCVESATAFLQGIEAVSQEYNNVLNTTSFLTEICNEVQLSKVSTDNILFVEIRPPPLLKEGILKRILLQSFQL